MIKKILQSVGLLIISSIFTALLIEIIVRLFFSEPILPRNVIDSGYGVRMNKPNIKTTHIHPKDYKVIINTNSAGMRGKKDYSITTSDNIYRIALLGDSHTFGYGCNDNEVVSYVLENQLNQQHSGKYEILNFGVSGFGQAEQLVTYMEKVKYYNPDLVIIFYFNNDIGNDIVSNLYSIENNVLLRNNNSYLPGIKTREILYSIPLMQFLFENSQAWNLVRNRLSSLIQKKLLSNKGLKGYDSSENKDDIILHKAIFLKLINVIKDNESDVGVVVVPRKKLDTNFQFKISDLKDKISFIIDGRNFLQTEDYYLNDGHLNPHGHNKLANKLTNYILNK